MSTINQEAHYRRMTQDSIPHLITQLAVPTIISMLVTSIYNMADTYFVGTISTSASGATGIVFSLMSILWLYVWTWCRCEYLTTTRLKKCREG